MDEQISEFIDDEMAAEECEFFVRRLEKNGEARACFLRYQLIGAAIRGEHLAFNAASSAYGERADGSSAPMPAPVAARRIDGRVAAGLGIAASLLLITVVAFTSLDLTDDVKLAGTLEVPGQVAPFDGDFMGMQYLMQHSGYATGLSRTVMHSSLISAPQFAWGDDVGDDDQE